MRKSIISLVVAGMAATMLSLIVPTASATPDHYTPARGVLFNNPYGAQRNVRNLIQHVNRTIDSVPNGQRIRISAWNVRSANITRSLVRAHNRGVSVQVVMDNKNWNPTWPNIDAARLYAGLKKGNKERPKEMRSWLRRCKRSCRGTNGIPHSKFYLFSAVKVKDGKTKKGKQKYTRVPWVTMYGSYNATELGATIQWNDLFTFRNDYPQWAAFEAVFEQMKKDKAVEQPYVSFDDGRVWSMFYPYERKGTKKDPVLECLAPVKCKGASTPSGRTKIRIAQTAMYGERGIKLATRIAQLRRAGCDIRLVYAMFGNEVLAVMRRAGVPLTHLAYDADDDGLYDRYVHMKAMAIHGNVGDNPDFKITYNGSANWTAVARSSDEIVGMVRNPKVADAYIAHIDYMFTHRPAWWGPQHPLNKTAAGELKTMGRAQMQEMLDERVERIARERGVDPYALIKAEL